MTRQISDILYYNGERYTSMNGGLFEPYLKRYNIKLRVPASCCWRGYIAHWRITDDKLYLTWLNAWIESKEPVVRSTTIFVRDTPDFFQDGGVGIDYFFPNKHEVFAKWFSGCAYVNYPEPDSMGFSAVYLLFKIRQGVIIHKKIKTHEEVFRYPYKPCNDKPFAFTIFTSKCQP